MKALIFALGTMLTATAAEAYTCRVDMVDQRGRILDTFYAQADYRTGTCRDGLRDCNLEVRTRNIRGARCEARNQTGPVGPGPVGPGPVGPGPVGPGPGMHAYSVTAIVENTLVELRGANRGQLFSQCTSQLMLNSADEMTIVTNNSYVRRLTTHGWWNGAANICTVIVDSMDVNSMAGMMPMDLYGTIERTPFNFRAYSKADALSQCYNVYRSVGTTSVDEMTIGVNNMSPRRITTGGWWSNAGQACKAFMDVVDQVIR
jgi:hypothetical protein